MKTKVRPGRNNSKSVTFSQGRTPQQASRPNTAILAFFDQASGEPFARVELSPAEHAALIHAAGQSVGSSARLVESAIREKLAQVGRPGGQQRNAMGLTLILNTLAGEERDRGQLSAELNSLLLNASDRYGCTLVEFIVKAIKEKLGRVMVEPPEQYHDLFSLADSMDSDLDKLGALTLSFINYLDFLRDSEASGKDYDRTQCGFQTLAWEIESALRAKQEAIVARIQAARARAEQTSKAA